MNQSIKKIVNVYQHTYNNYSLPIGFGDFLRGCLSLLQISKKFDIAYDIYINTSIHLYLKHFKHNEFIQLIHSNINYYTNQNTNFSDSNLHGLQNYYNYNNYLDGFISFCNNTTIHDNTIYILTNAYPIQNVTNDERQQIQHLLEPTDEITQYIDMTLNDIKISLKSYHIIHIRSGDDYLVHNHQMNVSVLNHISNIILSYVNDNISYIIISDNNELNTYIAGLKSNIKTIINKKIHTGKEVSDTTDIKNTLLDFYIMSMSTHILSFSVYGHGSSFSKWCAEIYNIPISSILI